MLRHVRQHCARHADRKQGLLRWIAWSAQRSLEIDEGMGFSPWHGIQAHRPLGALMRMRKLAYARSQQFRSERNRVPVREPGKQAAE